MYDFKNEYTFMLVLYKYVFYACMYCLFECMYVCMYVC